MLEPWVLLVEDDDNDAEMTERAFRPWREFHRLLRANDGEEALAIIEREGQPPKLVVTDLKMPKVNGFDVLNNLVGRGYPTTIFTGSGESRDVELAERAGCDGYQVKPDDFDGFMSVARGMFARFLGEPSA